MLKLSNNINIHTYLGSHESLQQYNRRVKVQFLGLLYEHLVFYPTTNTLTYFWSFGSLAGVFLVIQLITGIILVMHYKPSTMDAFNSVLHLMVDVPSGWLIRYLHANGASMFFIIIYIHMARGLYYGSHLAPRHLIWIVGVIIFLLLMGTAFIGYVLPWGQISFWGATVITNLISAIPFIGERIVYWIWGNFSIGDATLNRFFSLHYLLPFVVAFFVLLHLFLLHMVGSSNPLGLNSKYDYLKLPFYPFFYIKDIFGAFVLLMVYFYLVFFDPNLLGHADNYIVANAMVTPVHIVPEWYFLPFYAILRSIPNKFGGVIAMVGAIIMILAYATAFSYKWYHATSTSFYRSLYFLNFSSILFWVFICNFLLLGFIGGRPVEMPYLWMGQLSTLFFFLYWIIAPMVAFFEFDYFHNNNNN